MVVRSQAMDEGFRRKYFAWCLDNGRRGFEMGNEVHVTFRDESLPTGRRVQAPVFGNYEGGTARPLTQRELRESGALTDFGPFWALALNLTQGNDRGSFPLRDPGDEEKVRELFAIFPLLVQVWVDEQIISAR